MTTAKLTILYGHPEDPAAFESYYANHHLPFAQRVPGVERFELHRVTGTPGGQPAPFYRVAEMWYPDPETLRAVWSTDDGRAVLGDLRNFATGGATALICEDDEHDARPHPRARARQARLGSVSRRPADLEATDGRGMYFHHPNGAQHRAAHPPAATLMRVRCSEADRGRERLGE